MLKNMLWMKVICFIEESENIHKLSRKIDSTYPNLSKIAKEFEKRKWLVRTKIGREKHNKLTLEGKKIQDACKIILQETGGLKIKR